MNKVAAIIPAFNPQQSFVLFVQKLFTLDIAQIIIVNDGSDAKYEMIFKELATLENCHVIHHNQNYGKGHTLKTAFTYILEKRKNSRYTNGRRAWAACFTGSEVSADDDKSVFRGYRVRCPEFSFAR